MIKIVIASPGGSYTEGCVLSLLDTMRERKGYTQAFVNATSSDIYTVRNAVAVKALKALPDYDYMLWVDSDMAWSWDDVVKLIEADADVISGVCPIGLAKVNSALFRVDDEGEDALSYLNGYMMDHYPKTARGTVQVDMCGFGFLLLRRGVIETQGPQYFRHGNVVSPGGKELLTSEDMGFTWRCKGEGFGIEVHPEVFIKHQKRYDLEIKRE